MLWCGAFYLYCLEPYAFNVHVYFSDWPQAPDFYMSLIYAMEVGHYIYASIVLPLEPKQKDKYIMLSHHITAVLLLMGSHCSGYHKIGVVVVLVTDISDPFLEGAKVAQYMGYQQIADAGFTVFAVVFIVLRDLVYPYAILFPAFYYAWGLPLTSILQFLLLVLQVFFSIGLL